MTTFVPTKSIEDVYAPTTSGGAPRGADMEEALVHHKEFEEYAQSELALKTTVANLDALSDEVDGLAVEVEEVRELALLGVRPPKQSVRLLATTNIVIASALENGDTVDGVVVATGDRVALTGQSTPAQNGVYVVVASGAASRATDMDTQAELIGATFTVDAGSHAGETWGVSTTGTIVVGTTALTIVRTAAAASYGTEIVAARNAYASLDARLDADDATTFAALTATAYAELSEALSSTGSGVAIAFDAPLPVILIKDAAAPEKRFFGLLTAKMTSSRSGNAWYFDRQGLLQVAVGGTPRFTYDFKTLAAQGLLIEEARTNKVLWNRDLTNAAWTKTNVTAALNQVGLDGVASSASSITATGTNGTVLQSITIASAACFQSAYIKRLVGSGAIHMTTDGGATWTDVTPADAYWNRMSIPVQTLANPSVGFRIAVSGNSFAIDLVQNENGSFTTSPIVTTTAALTRNLELCTILLSGFPFNTALGSMFVEGRTTGLDTLSRELTQIDDGTSNNRLAMFLSSLAVGQFLIANGGATVANVLPGVTEAGKTSRMAASWNSNYAQAALDGAIGTEDTSLTVPTGLTSVRFGAGVSAGSPVNGTIAKFALLLRTMDATELAAWSNFGPPSASPAIDFLPNDSNIEDSDYAATLTATTSAVSGVRPISFATYGYANPGWRRRFKTRAKRVVLHFENLNLVSDSYNGKGQILVDGVHNSYFTSPQGFAGRFVVRLNFTSSVNRLIEIVMPISSSMAHRGITTYGEDITAPTSRSSLPRAVWLGDSRAQGFSATSIDKHGFEILCRAKGWQNINLGYGSSVVDPVYGTAAGNLNPDVVFVTFDYNNRTAQTPLATFKANIKTLIGNIRAIEPTVNIYVVSSNWISAAADTLTLKIADYRAEQSAAVSDLVGLGDTNLFYIDGLTLTANNTTDIPDGVHPADIGWANWAANIAGSVSV